MLRDTSSDTDVMRFEVWHKRMLQHTANINNSSSSADARSVVQHPSTLLTAAVHAVAVSASASECDSLSSSMYNCSIRRTSSYSSCCSSHDDWEL